LAASAAVCTATLAHAAPLVNVQVLGSTTNGSNYSSTLTGVTPGETVYYEVVGQIAAPGTSNENGYEGPPPFVVGTQTSVDGINSISLDLADSSGAALPAPSLTSPFMQGTGASTGAVTGSTVNGIFAIQQPGNFTGGTSPVQFMTGSFTAGTATSDTLAASFDSVINKYAGFQYNDLNSGQTALAAVPDTENRQTATADGNLPFDPFVGFTPLTITEGSPVVPAPRVIPALGALVCGLGIFGFVRRRHQIA